MEILAHRAYKDLDYGDYRLAWVFMAFANLAVIPVTLKLKAPQQGKEGDFRGAITSGALQKGRFMRKRVS
jgi:hypothetical protein